jgi:hypothetical protein
MENLKIKINPDQIYFPAINFNCETGICEISGESYMEETYRFYEPVLNWLNTYFLEKKPIIFNVKLTYFNTSSSRFILEILFKLKKYQLEGGDVIVNWYYKKQDADMLSEINDFVDETALEINTLFFN